MMRQSIILMALVATAAAGSPQNIVPNPGFENGRTAPEHWMAPDNLTVFWDKRGGDGRYLRFDSDVYRSEWEKRRGSAGDAPASPKQKTSGTRYNTVAGSVGVAVYSYPIKVEPDAWYLVEYDVKGKAGEPFLYLKGYRRCSAADAARSGSRIFFKPDPKGPSFSLVAMGGVGQEKRQTQEGDYEQVFRRRFVTRFAPGAHDRWHRCSGVVHLAGRHDIQVVLLELFAYWPPGTYCFDNVRMVRITETEAEAFKQARKSKYATPLPR